MLSLSQVQRFSICDRIKTGPFSNVYKAEDIKGQMFAVKLMPLKEEDRKKKGILRTLFQFGEKTSEFKEGRILKSLQGIDGIPKLYFQGSNPDIGAYMVVTELLGDELSTSFKSIKSNQSICKITSKLVDILKAVHKRGVIHRDIKPENILLSDDSESVYLIDFGLAKEFQKKRKLTPKKTRHFIGNIKYASSAAHFAEDLGAKHDMESLGYVLYHLYGGKLPWDAFYDSDFSKKIHKIGLKKASFLKTDSQVLPGSFKEYFTYIQGLKTDETVDYQLLKGFVENFQPILTVKKEDVPANEGEDLVASEVGNEGEIENDTEDDMGLSSKLRELQNLQKKFLKGQRSPEKTD